MKSTVFSCIKCLAPSICSINGEIFIVWVEEAHGVQIPEGGDGDSLPSYGHIVNPSFEFL